MCWRSLRIRRRSLASWEDRLAFEPVWRRSGPSLAILARTPGNPLACAVGLEALHILSDEKLAERSKEMGDYLLEKLHRLDSPLISDIRGRGLFVGVEIDPARASAREICEALMERGLLSKETHETVVRLAPPLVIERKEIDWAVGQISEVLTEMDRIRLAS